MNKSGFIENIENNEYHTDIEFLSSSQIKVAYYSLENFKYFVLDNRGQKNESPALNFGTAFHSIILEPRKFNDEIAVLDTSNMNLRTKAGREKKAQFLELNKEKTIITIDQMEQIEDMQMSFNSNEAARELISGGKAELSGYFYDELLGHKFRIRPDYINHDKKYIVDLKTTRSLVDYKSIIREVNKFSYDLSAALYMRGAKFITGDSYEFYWIFVQNVEPYSVAVFRCDPIIYYNGMSKLQMGIDKIHQAKHSNTFKEQSEIQDLGMAFPDYHSDEYDPREEIIY